MATACRSRSQPGPDGFVHGILERHATFAHCLGQKRFHIGFERNRGPHASIIASPYIGLWCVCIKLAAVPLGRLNVGEHDVSTVDFVFGQGKAEA